MNVSPQQLTDDLEVASSAHIPPKLLVRIWKVIAANSSAYPTLERLWNVRILLRHLRVVLSHEMKTCFLRNGLNALHRKVKVLYHRGKTPRGYSRCQLEENLRSRVISR